MAKGSEKFAWKQIGGKQPCAGCGRLLKVDEVGEVVTDYPPKLRGQRTRVFGVCCRGWRQEGRVA